MFFDVIPMGSYDPSHGQRFLVTWRVLLPLSPSEVYTLDHFILCALDSRCQWYSPCIKAACHLELYTRDMDSVQVIWWGSFWLILAQSHRHTIFQVNFSRVQICLNHLIRDHLPISRNIDGFHQVGDHFLGLQRELRGNLSLLLRLRGLKYHRDR